MAWHRPALSRAALYASPRKKRQKRAYDVHTRTARLHIRLDPAERDALDFLALKWNATRSDVVRSLIVGATLAECDRLDAAEPSFDPLVDVPSINDVLAVPLTRAGMSRPGGG